MKALKRQMSPHTAKRALPKSATKAVRRQKSPQVLRRRARLTASPLCQDREVVYLEEGLLKRAKQRRQRFKAKYAGLRREYYLLSTWSPLCILAS